MAMMIAAASLYAMEVRDEEGKGKAATEVEVPEGLPIPAEVIVEIIMNILPSALSFNHIYFKESALVLIDALQRIIQSLSLGHFLPKELRINEKKLLPRGVLFNTLAHQVKQHNYMPEILDHALEIAAERKELFIALILIKAGAHLPYDLFYNSIQFGGGGFLEFLWLLEKLKEIGITVNFNAMPGNGFTNPLIYLLALLQKLPASSDEEISYVKDTTEKLLQWASKTGYLRNLFAFGDEKKFSALKETIADNKERQWLMKSILKYDKDLYRELNK